MTTDPHDAASGDAGTSGPSGAAARRQDMPHAGPHTLLLAGAGSAGHVSPLLATAEYWRTLHPEDTVLVLGTAEGLEKELVPAAGFELLTIEKVPFPRRPNAAAVRFPRRFRTELASLRAILEDRAVDAVVGFGGYVCPPAYLTAFRARVPVVIHEANVRPGLANRLGARRAAAVATALPGTRLPGARTIGMPMRSAVAHLDRAAARDRAVRSFDLDPSRSVLLVTGGSLGAQRLNDAFTGAAADLTGAGVQVLHITGHGKFTDPHVPGYHVVEYVTDMERAYAAADLAVTRSGAGTVCELAAIGLPAILVPLPIGNGEQALNGRPMVEAGGALMVEDSDVDPTWVRDNVPDLVGDAARLGRMSAALERFGVRDADAALARLITGALSPKEA